MEAAVYYGRRDVRIEDVDEPVMGSNDVRVTIEYCGICGTDLHEFEYGPTFIPEETPHPLTGEKLPITIGHEFSGVISETGENVTQISSGDKVVVNPFFACESCQYCGDGEYSLCNSIGNLGIHGGGGGFAETIVVPAENVVKLPPEISFEQGALVEPLSVSLHAIRRSGLASGDTVAIFGAGPIGLGLLQGALASGAREVYVSEPQKARRELAAQFGANTLDPAEHKPSRQISAETEGGVDVAFDAAGVEVTLTQALRSTRKRGTLTIVSGFGKRVPINPDKIMMAERTVVGSYGYLGGPLSDRGEFVTAIQFIQDGRLDPEPMITGRLPLRKITEGFEKLLDPDEGHIKILVSPK